MVEKIAVLGAGSWGTALANVLSENASDGYHQHQVKIWARNKKTVDDINQNHHNTHYLPDALLNKKLTATTNLEQIVLWADALLVVIPTKGIAEIASQIEMILANHPEKSVPMIGHATKGIEPNQHLRISELLTQTISGLTQDEVYFIAGPSHAESVVRHDLTAVTVASNHVANGQIIRQALNNDRYFRAEYLNDLLGAEYAAAFKNVFALAGGMLAGAGYSDNAGAALITYALDEMKSLSKAYGAQSATLDSLAGLGDLIVTASSKNSRNYRAGFALGSGQSLEEAINTMGMVVEGINTTKVAYEMMQAKNLDLPIITTIYDIVNKGLTIQNGIQRLLSR